MQFRVTRGFTLIELLIVVAIVAILAAIAVPNFLEAQVRSKVARVKSDLRTITTALEAYFGDYNTYVNDSDNILGKSGEGGLALLTTPIAYLTTLPKDPFQEHISSAQASDPNRKYALHYALGSGADNMGWSSRFGTYGPQGAPRTQSWLLISIGTDVEPESQSDDTTGSDRWPWGGGSGARLLKYDPTNGSISDGDIYRAGGALNVGNYFVNGQKFGPIND